MLSMNLGRTFHSITIRIENGSLDNFFYVRIRPSFCYKNKHPLKKQENKRRPFYVLPKSIFFCYRESYHWKLKAIDISK